MRSNDLPALSKRLAELADYYDKKAPGASALRVWLDALGEASIDDVLRVLTDWPKYQRAMPLAEEVLRKSRNLLSDRIEDESKRNLASAGSLADLARALKENISHEAKRARSELSVMVSRMANRDPKAWARNMKAREEAGEVLNDCQRDAWREALRHAAEVA